MAPIAGLVTTYAMMLWYILFIEKIPMRIAGIISVTAAPISLIGIYGYMYTEFIGLLFVPYYVILISLLSSHTPGTLRSSLTNSLTGLLFSLSLYYFVFKVLDLY